MSEEYAEVQFTDGVEAAVEQPAEPTDASTGRRGRPRDQAVIERDTRVLDALSDGVTKTKAELAGELGLEPNTVYLSLWRLHKDGKVQRNQRVWQRV